MTFCVVTYRDNGEAQLGVLLADDGGLLAPPELKQWATMLELLENWPQATEVLADSAAARCAASGVRRPADADPLAAQGAVRGRQLPQAHQGDGRRGAGR